MPYKLMSMTLADGGGVIINPQFVVMATPEPQSLARTIVVLQGANLTIGVPYTQFCRQWEAALEGKPVLDS